MRWTYWIRQSHRWLSIVFTIAVIVTAFALSRDKPAPWASYLPLPPLFLMLLTGLWLFVVPYLRKRPST